MFQVSVFYGETRPYRRSMRCALDAAARFSSKALSVHVASDPDSDRIFGSRGQAFDVAQENRVKAAVERIAPQSPPPTMCRFTGELPVLPGNALVVSRSLGAERHNFHVLCPANETALGQRGAGPILVPFSDGESGLLSATIAFAMAERWRATRCLPADVPEVILYHTTWSDPKAVSDEAVDHMCDASMRNLIALQRLAQQRGIRFRVIVETHDDVVQGVVEIAQTVNATVIVVARGAQIRHGSYVERTLQQSPVPVLVVADNTPMVTEPATEQDLIAFKKDRRELARQACLSRNQSSRRCSWLQYLLSWMPGLTTPMTAVAIGGVSYLIKSIAKITVGLAFASPMVSGDGFHNLADLLQTAALALSVFIASRPTGGRYPWGRRNVEWFTQLGIGLLLFGVALKFIYDCGIGALGCGPAADVWLRGVFPGLPSPEAVHLDRNSFLLVLAVTGFSFLTSLVISRYQITVGRRNCSASLVAGGEEMRSDGWIELVTVGGVVLEFLTGWRLIEYVLGLLVAAFIIHTAWELITRGWRVLMQHSLGDEIETLIQQTCAGVHGVEKVAELKTFLSGDTAVVIITVDSLSETLTQHYVKKAVTDAITTALMALPETEFKSVYVHGTVSSPLPNRRRIGYPLLISGDSRLIAPSLEAASHLAVCDIEHGDPVRTKVLPLAADRVRQLIQKRITVLYAFQPTEDQARGLQDAAQKKRHQLIVEGAPAESCDCRGLEMPNSTSTDVIPIPRLEQSTCYVPFACGVVV